jgi:hypothetical protein
VKWLFQSPILLYRLGLGFLVGRLFMVMTTVGRKSGATAPPHDGLLVCPLPTILGCTCAVAPLWQYG